MLRSAGSVSDRTLFGFGAGRPRGSWRGLRAEHDLLAGRSAQGENGDQEVRLKLGQRLGSVLRGIHPQIDQIAVGRRSSGKVAEILQGPIQNDRVDAKPSLGFRRSDLRDHATIELKL